MCGPVTYGQVTAKNDRENVPGLPFINLLRPVTFHWDLGPVDNMWWNREYPFDMEISQELIDLELQARKAKEAQIQTGFIAKEVDDAAKSIGFYFSGVDADTNGVNGLRYAEFVVPLTRAVQELSAQNKWLLDRVSELTGEVYGLTEEVNELKLSSAGTGVSGIANSSQQAALYQNAPNSFSQMTEIKYCLPRDTKTASLNIYNLRGKQLKQIAITRRGESSSRIAGSEFEPGIYFYALIADGKEVAVKRLILN